MNPATANHWQQLLMRPAPVKTKSHLVQFYENEESLAEAVGSYVSEGLQQDDAVLVIATISHIEAFQKNLIRKEINYGKALSSNQLVFLNAYDIMSRLLEDSSSDCKQFSEVLRKVLNELLLKYTRVRAYGEVVDILRAQEKYDEMIRLEKCWTDLISAYPLSLLCGYWIKGFGRQDTASVFEEVCHLHTHVLPAEIPRLFEDVYSMNRVIAGLQQKAISLQNEVDERSRMEKFLFESEEKLKEAIRVRDEFVTIASHECRTPITSLKLQLQMMSRHLKQAHWEEVTPEKMKKFLDVAIRQVDRLSGLVEDMLDISRIEEGKLIIRPENTVLSEVIQCAIDEMSGSLTAAGCEWTLDLDSSVEGYWDAYRIEQVVINLLNNAIKYASGKPIHISVKKGPGCGILQVVDQGLGIESKDIERIFNRFERAISHSHISGLGLGLFISRQIVDAHQGKIRVESEVGKGSTFIVELPLREGE